MDAITSDRTRPAPDAPLKVPTVDDLLAYIDAFLARHPKTMSPTRLGLDAAGEGNLVKSLREGRQPSLEKAQRIVRFMAEHDAKFPPGMGGISPEWSISSATKADEIIRRAEAADAGEADSPRPFSPSSPISSPTSAPPLRPAGSAACSTGGDV